MKPNFGNDSPLRIALLVICFDMVGMGAAFYRSSRYRPKDQVRSLTLAKGVHCLDICNRFMDDAPVAVFASGGLSYFGGDKPDDLSCPACDIQSTRRHEPMHPDILDGRNAVALCEAIDRSIETRLPVAIPPPPALS